MQQRQLALEKQPKVDLGHTLKPPPFGGGGVGNEDGGGLELYHCKGPGEAGTVYLRVPASTFLAQAKPYINIRLINIVST